MKTKELRPICSMGMFDLLKGITIICIVIGHSFYCIDFSRYHPTLSSILTSLDNFLLYGFIIAAGFGIRKRPIKKCALQLKQMFLAPYIITALAASFLFSLNNYFLFSGFLSSLLLFLRSLLGFAVGQHPILYYGNYEMLNVGPAWFIVSLAGGWFILNLILNYAQGWKRNALVLLVSIIGHFGNLHSYSHNIAIPFCFFYMFVYVPGLYIGYLARENHWLEKKLSPAVIVLICLSIAAFAWNYKEPYEISDLYDYPLGIFTPYAAAVVGFGVTYLMTHINRRENPITNFFETIGSNSIYILFLHTVEYIGIPWSWFREVLSTASDKHIFCMIVILRFCFIALGMLVVFAFKNWGVVARLQEKLAHKGKA